MKKYIKATFDAWADAIELGDYPESIWRVE